MEKPDYYRIGVLHQKCKKISHGHINDIQHCPEFVSALLSTKEDYTDESVCRIITEVTLSKPKEDVSRRRLYKIARGVNKDVYGVVPETLKYSVKVKNGYGDLSYLEELLSPLSWISKDILLNSSMFLREVKKRGGVADIRETYEAFEIVFFRMARGGDKNSKEEKVRSRYISYRDIIQEFCLKLFGDKNMWVKRYSDYYAKHQE